MKKLLSFYFLTAATSFATELNFSSMENGDRMEITNNSSGCFHNTTSYYEVRKSDGTCFLTEYGITWNKGAPGKIAEKKVIGELKLTPKEIEGLDALLRFYRGKKDTNSTTLNSLLVEYYEGANQIRVEKLEDVSGGFGLLNRKDVTNFRDLTARFHQ